LNGGPLKAFIPDSEKQVGSRRRLISDEYVAAAIAVDVADRNRARRGRSRIGWSAPQSALPRPEEDLDTTAVCTYNDVGYAISVEIIDYSHAESPRGSINNAPEGRGERSGRSSDRKQGKEENDPADQARSEIHSDVAEQGFVAFFFRKGPPRTLPTMAPRNSRNKTGMVLRGPVSVKDADFRSAERHRSRTCLASGYDPYWF
jgi:hypothetical protein